MMRQYDATVANLAKGAAGAQRAADADREDLQEALHRYAETHADDPARLMADVMAMLSNAVPLLAADPTSLEEDEVLLAATCRLVLKFGLGQAVYLECTGMPHPTLATGVAEVMGED